MLCQQFTQTQHFYSTCLRAKWEHTLRSQRLIAAVLPLASLYIKQALEITRYHTKRNFIAYQCHRKKNLKKAAMLLIDVSL